MCVDLAEIDAIWSLRLAASIEGSPLIHEICGRGAAKWRRGGWPDPKN